MTELVKKPAKVISANILERIAEPASRFHPDYLAYRNQEITWAELVARLPHVAMIGDSVCTGVYVSSVLSTFWRARTCSGNNWFLDTGPSRAGIRSVSKRLEELTPFVAMEYAGIGALVDHEDERQNFFRRILRTHNFSGQIGQLLATERFPDLVLIAIGHNNVDWAWRCPPSELEQPENRLQRQSRRLRENFTRQMRRLIESARMQRHRVAAVVYGLVNFEAYFKGREIAERLRARDAARYPHLETTYKYFTSFRPVYRSNLIRLTAMVNEELRAMVSELSRDLGDNVNVQVRYSDALATADLSRAELLHPVDGWHASAEGHNILAEAAFSDLGPSLEFLGISRAQSPH
ncbi:MAG TPA: SGNH/GDSL hydrolase family protein [Candidatus Udaeobacter sp.]|nr:SGNH/GDSL hydrolase family protein [Candidatus Udaeobacter sp.]